MATTPATQTSYDEVPYPSHAFIQTHPDHLATIARLFGMQPPDCNRARILEIGCAAGGNLLPIAESLPEATLLGIDLSSRQVADGEQLRQAAGLNNVSLQVRDLMTLGPELGTFDYIICHGVYSWVPRPAQDKILELARDLLSPQGIAYVSYNTYPGWHMRGTIRDMMSYHSRRFDKPHLRIQQARALLDFLAQSISQENSAYGMLLKTELELLRKQTDSYLFHDYLEDVNEPLYFYQFMERVQATGLQYVGDAFLSAMSSANFSPAIERTLRLVATDVIQMEQYMDFLRNRTFRQTLLCKEGIVLNRQVSGSMARSFVFASTMRPENAAIDPRDATPATFVAANGMNVTTPDPVMKAGLLVLGRQWPEFVPFNSLLRGARSVLDGVPPEAAQPGARDAEFLGDGLIRCVATGLVEMRGQAPRFTTRPSERPLATPLARQQALRGSLVTNRRHEAAQLEDIDRFLLPRLDGEQTLTDLTADVVAAVQTGKMNMTHDHGPLDAPGQMEELVRHNVETSLLRLARNALLVS